MLPPSPVTAELAKLDTTLNQILTRRPDLEREALYAAIAARAEVGQRSVLTWAEHCLERVRRNEPLPWEPGATGAGADA